MAAVNQPMPFAAPCAVFTPLVFIRARIFVHTYEIGYLCELKNLRRGILVFCFFPTLAANCMYGAPLRPHPKFSSLWHSPRYLRTGLLESHFSLDSGFYSTLVRGVCMAPQRGPCTVSSDGEGQRGQLPWVGQGDSVLYAFNLPQDL